MATMTKHCVSKRMGAYGVSEEAQEVVASYKRAHFGCLIGQRTFDDYVEQQRKLYDVIRGLENIAEEAGVDLEAFYARVR